MEKSPTDQAARLLALFAGNESAHGTHGEPVYSNDKNKWEIRSTARSLRTPATLALWVDHLTGKAPLGVVPVRDDGSCLWGSIDLDEYDNELTDVIDRAQREELPLVPCRSKSGGLHLFLFLAEQQPAAEVMALLRGVAARLGIAGSEVFPKQAQVLTDRGDVGSWIVMPYFGSTYGGKLREQVGLKRTGSEMTLDEFLGVAEERRVTTDAFRALARRPAGPPAGGATKRPPGSRGPTGPDFSDGPPCLQHLAAMGVEQGGQNNTLLMMGIYYKRRNPGGWKADLERANQTFLKPPGASDGLASVIKSLEKKEYEYTCKVEPMASHCDSRLCVHRKFGVGDGSYVPRISSISKLNVEPPLWFVDIEDKRLELSTEELQQYQRFHRTAMDQLNRCYGMMTQGAWLQVVNEAMQNVTIIDAPKDAGAPAQFHELLEEFCTNRTRGVQREDLLTGRPWLDDETGRHYFRLADLQKFLQTEGMLRNVERNRLIRRLQALGGGAHFFNIKNRGCNVWWVPGKVFEARPEPKAPPIPRETVA